jgi:hypothetical protein
MLPNVWPAGWQPNTVGLFCAFFQAYTLWGRPVKDLIYRRGQAEEKCTKIPSATFSKALPQKQFYSGPRARCAKCMGLVLHRGREGLRHHNYSTDNKKNFSEVVAAPRLGLMNAPMTLYPLIFFRENVPWNTWCSNVMGLSEKFVHY